MQYTHSTHLCFSVHGCTTCTMHSEAPKAACRAQLGHCSIVTGTLRTSQVLCRHQDSAGQPAGGKMGLAAICTMFECLDVLVQLDTAPPTLTHMRHCGARHLHLRILKNVRPRTLVLCRIHAADVSCHVIVNAGVTAQRKAPMMIGLQFLMY